MKYIVESLSIFREIHVVEAENKEIAEKIARIGDYNMSKWLGQQTATIYEYSDEHVERFRKEDEFFWDGVMSVDSDGRLCYQIPGASEPTPSQMGEKIE